MMKIKQAVWTLAAAVVFGLGAAATANAGPLLGPKLTADRVGAFKIDSYKVVYIANDPAVVALKGDGDTNLELRVFDGNGNLIASDLDDGDGAVVTWRPKWTGTFTIEVVNLGPVYNNYGLGTK
jgi:hypothetical protein